MLLLLESLAFCTATSAVQLEHILQSVTPYEASSPYQPSVYKPLLSASSLQYLGLCCWGFDVLQGGKAG